MIFASHPLWLAGFRPFFSLACAAGAVLPALWTLVYLGLVEAPPHSFSIVQWHAHEMFFGFTWAVLGGFLLTASKNWVGIRGYHGAALMFLAAAWLFERAGMWFGGAWPPALFLFSNNVFLAAIVAMLLWTLIRHRSTDSYRDNVIFVLILPVFLPAKYWMLSAENFQLGWMTAVALFRVSLLVMLERTLSQFMKNTFRVDILRHPALDGAIKLLAIALVGAGFLPPATGAALSIVLALLLLVRLYFWYPRLALQRLDVGIMYLGYLAIVLQLLLDVLDRLVHPAWIGSVVVHVFTLGVIGLIAPALLVRISKGHTGRKVVFEASDKWVLYIMLLALMLRVVAPQLHPAGYTAWIVAAALCWSVGFAWLGWRYIPILWQPRVDGKEH